MLLQAAFQRRGDEQRRKRRRAGGGGRNNGKGLRHFSMKVCEKVESKGRTTYNEVADELVGEFSGAAPTLLATSAVHLCNTVTTMLMRACHPSPERCQHMLPDRACRGAGAYAQCDLPGRD